MGRKKIQYEEIKAFIEGHGCKLLTTKEEYESNGMNTHSKLEIKCKCGKTFPKSFRDFKSGQQCKECGISKISESHKRENLSVETRKKLSESRKGKKHSEKTRKKLSESHKRENLSVETRKKLSEARKGKKTSEETRKKLSEASKGKKHPNWKGGRTSISNHLREYIKPWKKDRMKYSDYKSVISEKPFKHIHHVNKNFSEIAELTFKIANIEIKETIEEYTSEELEKLGKICLMLHYLFGPGVCLTEEEHKLFHSLYGKHDNTKEQFEEFEERFQNGEFIE